MAHVILKYAKMYWFSWSLNLSEHSVFYLLNLATYSQNIFTCSQLCLEHTIPTSSLGQFPVIQALLKCPFLREILSDPPSPQFKVATLSPPWLSSTFTWVTFFFFFLTLKWVCLLLFWPYVCFPQLGWSALLSSSGHYSSPAHTWHIAGI